MKDLESSRTSGDELKSSLGPIAKLGDDLFFNDMCIAFNIERGERDVHNLVLAMARRIVELASPQQVKKKASGGRPPKWTPEAEAVLIVDVRREMAAGNGVLAAALNRLASVEPWKRLMANCGEQGAPDALMRAYTRAKRSDLASEFVEDFDRYRTELGRDLWRARSKRVIEESIALDKEVRKRVAHYRSKVRST